MSNPFCNDDPGRPEACKDDDIFVKRQGKETSCDDNPAKLNRKLPFCTAIAVEGGQPNTIILPLVDNVFSFEVSNDANLPFTFEWFLGCPGAPIRKLDPSEVEFINNEPFKSTISFRPSHLEATGVAVVVDDTPGNVIKTTTGLFAVAKSRCGDFVSDCINELGLLPNEIQEYVNSFGMSPDGLAVKEFVNAYGFSVLESHFVKEFGNAFSFITQGPHLVKEFVNAYGFEGNHPNQDIIFT